MKIIRAKDYDQMSRKAANIISAQVIMKPDCVLGLATGSSPLGIYRQLIDWYNKGDVDFSECYSVNLDEYVGLDITSDQSYVYFMHHNFFDSINIRDPFRRQPLIFYRFSFHLLLDHTGKKRTDASFYHLTKGILPFHSANAHIELFFLLHFGKNDQHRLVDHSIFHQRLDRKQNLLHQNPLQQAILIAEMMIKCRADHPCPICDLLNRNLFHRMFASQLLETLRQRCIH
jgi:hypothetical protein